MGLYLGFNFASGILWTRSRPARRIRCISTIANKKVRIVAVRQVPVDDQGLTRVQVPGLVGRQSFRPERMVADDQREQHTKRK